MTLKGFLKKLDVTLIELPAAEQDRLVAGISHLPIAVASSLVNTIAGAGDRKKFASVASSGFRDTTRVASGSPVMGVDLFMANREAVLKMIAAFKKDLGKLETLIKKGDAPGISRYLVSAKKFRDGICSNG